MCVTLFSCFTFPLTLLLLPLLAPRRKLERVRARTQRSSTRALSLSLSCAAPPPLCTGQSRLRLGRVPCCTWFHSCTARCCHSKRSGWSLNWCEYSITAVRSVDTSSGRMEPRASAKAKANGCVPGPSGHRASERIIRVTAHQRSRNPVRTQFVPGTVLSGEREKAAFATKCFFCVFCFNSRLSSKEAA